MDPYSSTQAPKFGGGYDTAPIAPSAAYPTTHAPPPAATFAAPIMVQVPTVAAPAVATSLTAPPRAVMDLLSRTCCFCFPFRRSFKNISIFMIVFGVVECIFAFPFGLVIGLPTLGFSVYGMMKHKKEPTVTWPFTAQIVLGILHAVLSGLSILTTIGGATAFCKEQQDEWESGVPFTEKEHEAECYQVTFAAAAFGVIATVFLITFIHFAVTMHAYRRTVTSYGGALPDPRVDIRAVLTMTPAAGPAGGVGVGVPVATPAAAYPQTFAHTAAPVQSGQSIQMV